MYENCSHIHLFLGLGTTGSTVSGPSARREYWWGPPDRRRTPNHRRALFKSTATLEIAFSTKCSRVRFPHKIQTVGGKWVLVRVCPMDSFEVSGTAMFWFSRGLA